MDIDRYGPDLRVASLRLTQRAELTVLMPCLNEAETVATCAGKAVAFLVITVSMVRPWSLITAGRMAVNFWLKHPGRGWSRWGSGGITLHCPAAFGRLAASM